MSSRPIVTGDRPGRESQSTRPFGSEWAAAHPGVDTRAFVRYTSSMEPVNERLNALFPTRRRALTMAGSGNGFSGHGFRRSGVSPGALLGGSSWR